MKELREITGELYNTIIDKIKESGWLRCTCGKNFVYGNGESVGVFRCPSCSLLVIASRCDEGDLRKTSLFKESEITPIRMEFDDGTMEFLELCGKEDGKAIEDEIKDIVETWVFNHGGRFPGSDAQIKNKAGFPGYIYPKKIG
jgi:hypothetical protein